MGIIYFYLNEPEKAKFFHNKCSQGNIEDDNSVAKLIGKNKAKIKREIKEQQEIV